RVGIGTDEPDHPLHVIGNGYFTGAVRVATPVSGNDATTKNYVDTTTVGLIGDQTIEGNKTFSATTTLSADSATINLSSTTGTKTINTGGTTHLNLAPGGNVGIGTGNPGRNLQIDDIGGGMIQISSGRDPDNKAQIGIIRYVSTTQSEGHNNIAQIDSRLDGETANQRGGTLQFFTKTNGETSLTEKMRITNSGDVGIGEDEPTQKLHVAGNTHITGTVTSGAITSGTITGTSFLGTALTSTFRSASYSVSGVSTSFVNSGFVIPNVNGSWIVTIHAAFTGGFSSTATYVVTAASWSKTLNLIGGPSNHFGNGNILAQLSASSAANVNFQVRKSTTTGGDVTIITNVLRLN
ncbi:MAG: hypothetical protein ACMXYD_04930, partial [Candidatus Woesearchaeota archaeon]